MWINTQSHIQINLIISILIFVVYVQHAANVDYPNNNKLCNVVVVWQKESEKNEIKEEYKENTNVNYGSSPISI